jgi:hypothetical protein
LEDPQKDVHRCSSFAVPRLGGAAELWRVLSIGNPPPIHV